MTTTESTPHLSFVRRVGWLTLGQGAEKLSQVVMVVALARILPHGEWNTLALALTVYVVGVTVVSFNLEHSIVYFVPRIDVASAERLVARTFFLLMAAGTTAAGSLLLVQSVWSPLHSKTDAFLVAVTFVTEPATVIGGALFLVRGDERASGVWDFTMSSVQLLAVILPAVAGWGATGALWGLACAGAVRFASFVGVFRPSPTGISRGDGGLLRGQLRFCVPIGLTLAAGVLAKSIDKWMVALHLPRDVGVYAVAAHEVPVLVVLPYAGGAAIAVRLVKLLSDGHRRDAHMLWWDQVDSMTAMVVPAAMFVTLVAPELVVALFGGGFGDAVAPFRMFTLVSLHRVTEYGAVLRAAGRAGETVWSSLILLAGSIVFGWFGLLHGGLVGLTVGTVLAFLVSWLWTLHRLGRVFGLSVAQVFPWASWLTHVGSATSAFAVSVAVASLVRAPMVAFLAKVIVYACIIAATRAVIGRQSDTRRVGIPS
ncbi:MAG: hypothetical protein RLZZ544_1373 [Actinomycetota bacterium]